MVKVIVVVELVDVVTVAVEDVLVVMKLVVVGSLVKVVVVLSGESVFGI